MEMPSKIIATYDYCDADGPPLFQVVRYDPKDFTPRRRGQNSDWIWNLDGVCRMLYGLSERLKADPSEPVLIAEGEEDVKTIRSLGFVGTTNPGGAGKWRREYSACLRDRHVMILPDNDQQGHQHAGQVARALLDVAASVKLIKLPGLTEKGEISDGMKAGHTREALLQLIKETPELRPEELPPALEIEPQRGEDRDNPWRYAQDAPSFLAAQEKELEGLARDL